VLFQPCISGYLFARRGTENLFGTSAGASYDKIGSRSPYSLNVTNASLSLPAQIAISGSLFTVLPAVSYVSYKEKYSEPLRKVEFNRVSPEIKMQLSLALSRSWLWDVEATGSYNKAFGKQYVMNDFDGTTALGECVVDNYSMMSADNVHCGITCGVSCGVGGMVLKLSAHYIAVGYCGMNVDTHQSGVAIKAMF
ncbi:MAG: hypothetical protein K2J74_00405, partial [Muribaculaceae bacterium]|nr:hypothetical protein [Muribaculaceae bacterium]